MFQIFNIDYYICEYRQDRMQEQTLEDKQNFLSNQILQANYDPEEFQDFMVSNSDKQLELDDWTLTELKAIVHKFKKYKTNQNEQENQHEQTIKQLHEQQLQEYIAKKQEDNQQGEGSDRDDDVSIAPTINSSLYKNFEIRKKINLPEMYLLIFMQKKNFHVSLKNFSKVSSGGIFKSQYVLYEIETSENWAVKRRFTDFLWLHKNLKKAYPGLPIPPIPSKTTMRSFDEHHLQDRMIVFQKFLNTLTYMPEICSDPILQIFLRADSQYFGQAKKKFEEQAKQNYQTCTMSSIWGSQLVLPGIAVIENDKSSNYNNLKSLYQKIIENIEEVQSNLLRTSNSCFNLASLYESSQPLVKQFRQNSIMNVFQDFFIQIGDYLNKTINHMKNNVTNVWKYESMYIANLTQSINQIKKQQIQITQKYKSAMIKISDEGMDKLAHSEPTKPIKDYQIAKQQYKIKLSYISREINRCENQQLARITQNWSKSIKLYIADINQLAISQVDQLTRTLSISEGKDLMQVEYIEAKQ